MKEKGLSFLEAKKSLEKFGPNLLPEEKRLRVFSLFLSQFKSPLLLILIFAGIVSLFLKEITDSIIIFLAVFVNTIFGFYQEYKAEKTLDALKKIIPQKVKVIREGKKVEIDISEVVPEDIVVITSGEKIPADGILIEAYGLSVNEAVLTGESSPVKKGINDKIFKGTIVLTGHGKFKVTKTGINTEFGKIAKMIKTQKEEKTPLQKRLEGLAKSLGLVFLFICFLIFIIGVFYGYPILTMFETSVAIAVASIPEGLAISLTVILTVSMRRILTKKALVRKLIAAETLGTTTVICTDKTGTITEGLMKVTKVKMIDKEITLKGSVLCNNLHDPEEISLWEWAKENHFDPQKEIEASKKVFEIPFSSERKYMLTVNKVNNEEFIFVKGAPEVIFKNVAGSSLEKWQKLVELWAKEGLRVLALAYKKVKIFQALPTSLSELKDRAYSEKKLEDFGKFSLLAVFAFEDPIREGVSEALKLCQEAGIKVKIITGDFVETAEAVAKKLGLKVLPEEILEGHELEVLAPPELERKILKTKIFARVKPEQKYKIVQSLKNQGEVVAVTGDGVNDAPALKKADIGIVVAKGSEVAKETADMVLLDSNFSTIVSAVYEGRVIFENLKKVVIYLLADAFTEVVLISSSLLFSLPLPILPAQILWVNLFNDGLPNLALAFEKEDKEILKEPPRKKDEPILDSEAKIIIFIVGIITDLFLFLIFLWFYRQGYPIEFIRSFVFAALGIDSILYVFSCKTFRKNLWQVNLFKNQKLIFAVLFSFIFLYSAFFFPPLMILLKTEKLLFWEWGLLLFLGFFQVFLIETVKFFYLKKSKKDLFRLNN